MNMEYRCFRCYCIPDEIDAKSRCESILTAYQMSAQQSHRKEEDSSKYANGIYNGRNRWRIKKM